MTEEQRGATRTRRRLAAAMLSGLILLAGPWIGAVAAQPANIQTLEAAEAAGSLAFRIERLAGNDRYATAAAVSRRFFAPGVAAVFVASGQGFPDGLAAGPAADSLASPVLFSLRDTLPTATRTEIQRLKPQRIYVVGGSGVISDAVLSALAPLASAGATRIAGSDRYATAAEVAKTFFPTASTVFVATGLAFPDGLTGGAAAAVRDGPVLLVRPDSIPPATAAQLQRLAPSRVVIVGGTGVISGAVEANLRAYATTVQRAAGADRYGTALAVSQATFAGVASAVFIASGANFPDALGAIPAAGQRLGPVLLVPSATLPSAVSAELARLDPDVVFLLGGESVVAPLVAKLVQKRLGACWSGQKPGAGAQQIFSRIPNAPNQVALTFDMGGRLDPALSIVQFLIDNQVCATIFPTGAMSQTPVGQQVLALIRAHPELFELGNHTMHHCDLVRGGAGSPTTAPCSTGGAPTADFIRRQMTDAAAILKAGTGMDPVPYWRPPYGSYNQAVLNAAASVGYTKTFMWDIDTIDWKPISQGGPTAAQIAAKVVNNAVSGSNVLMHLGGYETLGALPTMVSGLRSRGFTTTSLSDTLDG